jgi:REP element-mobilizing transposase RayT
MAGVVRGVLDIQGGGRVGLKGRDSKAKGKRGTSVALEFEGQTRNECGPGIRGFELTAACKVARSGGSFSSMPQSLSQLYVHLVFSTRERAGWLTPEVQDRLFPYLAGALKGLDCPTLKVGGHVDHVHLLFRLSKNKAASRVVGDLKGESSKWVKREFPDLEEFAWQAGYGLFSVSSSQV